MIKKVVYEKIDGNINDSLMYSFYNNFISYNDKLINEYEEFELNQMSNKLSFLNDIQEDVDLDMNNVISGISATDNDIVMICDINE